MGNLIHKALKMLQIEHLCLGVFEQSLPSLSDEETGRGSLYSRGAAKFFEFIKNLGFTTIQTGPQGKTTRSDPSPYNSTIFSKNPLSLSLYNISENFPELLPSEELPPPYIHNQVSVSTVDYLHTWDLIQKYSALLYQSFKEKHPQPLNTAFSNYQDERKNDPINWIERDAVYNVLSDVYETDNWHFWPNIDKSIYTMPYGNINFTRINDITNHYEPQISQYSFIQFLLNFQHSQFKQSMNSLGLKIYGDLQIGYSHQDTWSFKNLFLPEYLMGAPPSRSNPEGQPWGYPVLNPDLFFEINNLGPALRLMQARIDKMFTEYNGLRIDHPHGLVCPWVYRSDDPDPLHAVQNGTRLYSSPNIPNHEYLSHFAIINESQLNSSPSTPRYGDDWEIDLTPEQIDRYATIIDLIIQRAEQFGAGKSDIISEVLSTWPLPLKKVMQTRKLGRFCITQKADPHNPADIYRRENTARQDWIMPGNHDTKPVWLLVSERFGSQWYNARAHLLAKQFAFSENDKVILTNKLLSDRNCFCMYLFAELFLGPAQHVYIFFSDLFGFDKIFNRPGLLHPENWSLRIPPDFNNFYKSKVSRNEALVLPNVLALALKARFPEQEEALALSEKLSEST